MPLYQGNLFGTKLYDRGEIWAQRVITLIGTPEHAQAVGQYKINWTGTESTESKILIYISFDGASWDRVQNNVLTKANPDKTKNASCVKLKTYLMTKDISQKPVINNLNLEIFTELLQDGPVIPEVIFNYIPVSDCLNSLAEKVGFWWNVDAYKRVNFVSKVTNPAPWTVTERDIIGEPVVTQGNPQYRNKQYILGGKATTAPLSEIKFGDGNTKTITVGFPMAAAPAITVNNQPKTVGTKGVDDGKTDWYWSKGDSVITSDTPLANGAQLQITYQGEYPIVGIYSQSFNISKLKNLVGSGTGIIENVTKVETNSQEAALQNAIQLIQQYSIDGRKLQFKTDQKGLKPGQLLNVNLPRYGIQTNDKDHQMLIQSVNIQDNVYQLLYEVTAVEGPIDGSWAKFFYNLLKPNVSVIRDNISENEVFINILEQTKNWLETDEQNIFRTVYPAISLYPGSNLYPQFAFGDRIKCVALIDNNNNEISRSLAIDQKGAETNTIITTFYFQPNESLGNIKKIYWYGGATASLQPGSGVKIDEMNYEHTKTNLEAIEILRTDTKGWKNHEYSRIY